MSLVLWSGGCDSTLVLWNLAQKSSVDKPVHALSIEHTQVGAQPEQAKARASLLKVMRAKGCHIEHSHVKITLKGPFHYLGGGATQPIMWLLHAIPFLNKKENLHFGLVYGDNTALQCIEDIRRVFDACQRMREHSGKLITPFLNNTKSYVIGRLKELKLYKQCWWCEQPVKGKQCGKCGPCITHATALWHGKKWPSHFGMPANTKVSKRRRRGK